MQLPTPIKIISWFGKAEHSATTSRGFVRRTALITALWERTSLVRWPNKPLIKGNWLKR